MDKLKPTLEIIVRDKEVIFISYSGEFHHKTVLLLDEEVDETIAVEYRIKVGYNQTNFLISIGNPVTLRGFRLNLDNSPVSAILIPFRVLQGK